MFCAWLFNELRRDTVLLWFFSDKFTSGELNWDQILLLALLWAELTYISPLTHRWAGQHFTCFWMNASKFLQKLSWAHVIVCAWVPHVLLVFSWVFSKFSTFLPLWTVLCNGQSMQAEFFCPVFLERAPGPPLPWQKIKQLLKTNIIHSLYRVII